mgnify:CR=1 FL=1
MKSKLYALIRRLSLFSSKSSEDVQDQMKTNLDGKNVKYDGNKLGEIPEPRV